MAPTYIDVISSDEEEDEVIVQPHPDQIIDLTPDDDDDEMSTGSCAPHTSKRFLKKLIFIHIL
jgi:hypothetical protein